jgi:DNA topoisomerase-3
VRVVLVENPSVARDIAKVLSSSEGEGGCIADQSIRAGFGALRHGADFDPLADAAMCRAKADWSVGLNFTQAYTVPNDQHCTAGRVQAPTLALAVDREMEIKRFVETPFYELHVQFKEGVSALHIDTDRNWRIWTRPPPKPN